MATACALIRIALWLSIRLSNGVLRSPRRANYASHTTILERVTTCKGRQYGTDLRLLTSILGAIAPLLESEMRSLGVDSDE